MPVTYLHKWLLRFVVVLSLEVQKQRAGELVLGILSEGKLQTLPSPQWYLPLDTTASGTDLISSTQLVVLSQSKVEL